MHNELEKRVLFENSRMCDVLPKTRRIVFSVLYSGFFSDFQDQLEEHVHPNVHLQIYTHYGSTRVKDPDVLAKQDVVITTYQTLAAEAKVLII